MCLTQHATATLVYLAGRWAGRSAGAATLACGYIQPVHPSASIRGAALTVADTDLSPETRMRHPLLSLAAVCALLAPVTLHAPHAQAASPATAAAPVNASARVIVKFKQTSALGRRQALSVSAENQRHVERADALGQRLGIALQAGAGVGERTQVLIAKGMTSGQLAARLSRESDIEYAVVDQRRHR